MPRRVIRVRDDRAMRALRLGGGAGPADAPAAPPPPPPARTGRARPGPVDERAIRRASRAAASDASWREVEPETHLEDRTVSHGGAGSSGAPAAPPPPPPARTGRARPGPVDERAILRASRAAAFDASWREVEPETHLEDHTVSHGGAGSSGAPAAPPLPPLTRTRKFPRGHKFHSGPRLLTLPAERRWESVGCTWMPPTWDTCRKFNRLDCTGADMKCPHERMHACSECGGGHPAPHCLVGEDDLPPPDPPQGPPQRPAQGGR